MSPDKVIAVLQVASIVMVVAAASFLIVVPIEWWLARAPQRKARRLNKRLNRARRVGPRNHGFRDGALLSPNRSFH